MPFYDDAYDDDDDDCGGDDDDDDDGDYADDEYDAHGQSFITRSPHHRDV